MQDPDANSPLNAIFISFSSVCVCFFYSSLLFIFGSVFHLIVYYVSFAFKSLFPPGSPSTRTDVVFFFLLLFFISSHWFCGVFSSWLLVANLLFVFELLIKIKSFSANKWAVFLQFVTKTYFFLYRIAMGFRENLHEFIHFWPKSDNHFRRGRVIESAQNQTNMTVWRGI